MREENIKLRKAGEAAQCKINGLQNNIKSLSGMVSKKEEKIMKSEKYNAKALKEHVALREALRKAQAECDARSKKQSEKIENPQKDKNVLKKSIVA